MMILYSTLTSKVWRQYGDISDVINVVIYPELK